MLRPAQLAVPLVALTVIVAGAQPPDAGETFALSEATTAQMQEWMAAGRFTARRITELYLQRIREIDQSGPALRSIIEVNPDALTIADALDAERARSGPRGPLHGIPVVIKDNIDTADAMTTTAGSLALEGSIAPRDAFIAAKLRSAGAVILGKTNLSEWANFRSTSSTSGWSGRGGLVKNPYLLDRNACGSSSGTGAAIAANLAALGVGTETDGSIVCPSSVNGLVGIKPTVGLVSRSGIIPISKTQDTAGPMARTVGDAAVLLSALRGVDPADPATRFSSAHQTRDYARSLDRNALQQARIGVARKRFFGYSTAADRLVESAIADLRTNGAVIIDPADIPMLERLESCEMEVMLYEFKDGLNTYLANLRPSVRVRSLKDLIAFNERERVREMPYFGQELLIRAEQKGPLTEPAYQHAFETCRTAARRQGIDAVLTTYRLDAIVAPTGSPAWTTDLVNGDHFTGASSTPAAVAGYPSITVPAGLAQGLPVGLTFIGGEWSESRLIALAYAYEQATRHRRPPQFLPSMPRF